MAPEITIFFVAIFALMQLVITIFVGLKRNQLDIRFYDEGDIDLRKRVRAHANFTETVPITLMAMAGAEILTAPSTLIWAFGLILLVARLWHYIVIRTTAWGNGRAISMGLTFISMSGSALAILWQLISSAM